MRLLFAGILIGAAFGVGTTAMAGPSASPQVCRDFLAMRTCVLNDPAIVRYSIIVPALDVECDAYPRADASAAGYPVVSCERATTALKCVDGALGSLTSWITKYKMSLLTADPCERINAS